MLSCFGGCGSVAAAAAAAQAAAGRGRRRRRCGGGGAGTERGRPALTACITGKLTAASIISRGNEWTSGEREKAINCHKEGILVGSTSYMLWLMMEENEEKSPN